MFWRKIPFSFLPLAALFFFTLCLVRLDRFFLKANDHFCAHFILSPLSYRAEWDADAKIHGELFDQPFHYLTKGSQNFVFESADGQYVVKFYRFPSHMRQFSWVKRPLVYQFQEKRKKIKERNFKRFVRTFNSYWIAYQELKEETAIVYLHLNPTSHLNKSILLIDKLGMHTSLPLNQLGFYVQKKAPLFFPCLQEAIHRGDLALGKKMIDSLIHIIQKRCEKGVADLDAMIHKNCGWLDGKAVFLDVGRLVKRPSLQKETEKRQELMYMTQVLKEFLAEHSPELSSYLTSRLE